jgi:OmpA-OmpF porin, OOP family
MRLRALLFAGIALGASGAGAWHLADRAAEYLEERNLAQLSDSLKDANAGWLRVEVDGLRVELSGTAPDEAARFHAIEVARRTVAPDRVIDKIEVASPNAQAAPDFALELLRNDAEISLIGLVPAYDAADVVTADAIRSALAGKGVEGGITDMLETADYPAPDGWQESLDYALDVLSTLPRAKISVRLKQVDVMTVADSADDRAALETRLDAMRPDGVVLGLDISSPRPVITPFEVAYRYDGETGAFTACTAEDDAAVARIMEAAREVADTGPAPCAIGLGAPSPDWPDAVAAGIAALGALGGGTFTLTDTEAVLTGDARSTPQRLKAAETSLRASLPETYSLAVNAPPRMEVNAEGVEVYAPRFMATLEDDGQLRLGGVVRDETSRNAIQSYAAAMFGHDRVTDATVLDPDVPEGWPGRVIAGIDALGQIKEGDLVVTDGGLAIDGSGINEDDPEKIAALIGDRVENPTIAVRFDAEAAAAAERALVRARMSRPEICADEIDAILDSGSISFRAGSAEIEPASMGIIAAIADVLRSCPGARFEVAGHTDSQGEEALNERLSTGRADAVRAALEAQDIPLITFRTRGYGSQHPVASNATPDGRKSNRRIELLLFENAPAPEAGSETASADPDALTPQACASEVTEVLGRESIVFETGASAISLESQHVISDLAETLQKCAGSRFEIGGHTDSIGRAEVNERISAERAEAVRKALEAAGVPGTVTLSSRGYGAKNPVADNSTREGRALNRRIEMKLLAAAGINRQAAADDGTADAVGDGADAPMEDTADGSD